MASPHYYPGKASRDVGLIMRVLACLGLAAILFLLGGLVANEVSEYSARTETSFAEYSPAKQQSGWVYLTDTATDPFAYVYRERRHGTTQLEEAWIPVHPAGEPDPEVRVLLYTRNPTHLRIIEEAHRLDARGEFKAADQAWASLSNIPVRGTWWTMPYDAERVFDANFELSCEFVVIAYHEEPSPVLAVLLLVLAGTLVFVAVVDTNLTARRAKAAERRATTKPGKPGRGRGVFVVQEDENRAFELVEG